ncbi:hypothetical protein BC939DRAFT_489810 [Gamsiella multidivaricata]|uniref:uncharacterized protein n=1 Tax=Gamsiella multidivaricata TaxID=101098 RepID=UPI00221E9212|nr:uncharacterized protein BC939DRAFT_489810 [Gamsiella multidivaricata]KAI7830433.1 hypothetical protein BC939DRAFT_489810 [Gamsiella multidivaricata]
MISPPSYTGPVAVLSEDIITLTYFRTTKASEWSLEGFLASTRLTELVFMSSLKDIARIKRLPSEIQIFAKRLEDYYDGVFQEEVIEVAKNNARKNVNRTLLSGKEHVLLQSYVDDTLERDKTAEKRYWTLCRESEWVAEQEQAVIRAKKDKEMQQQEGVSQSSSTMIPGYTILKAGPEIKEWVDYAIEILQPYKSKDRVRQKAFEGDLRSDHSASDARSTGRAVSGG